VLGNGGNVSLWQQRRENQTTGLRPEENKLTALEGAGKTAPFGGWRHHLARWEACHWILRHRAGYLSEGAFMGRLGANVSGLAYSYAEYAPIGSLRIQFPCHPPKGGTMGAGRWRQFEFMAAAERKPNNRAPPGGKQANRPVGRLKCTPSAAYRRRLPRRGRFALHSASGLISISRHSAAKTSPSGGSTAAGGDRGAFPTGAARLYGFPFRESELQNSSLRRSDTTTL